MYNINYLINTTNLQIAASAKESLWEKNMKGGGGINQCFDRKTIYRQRFYYPQKNSQVYQPFLTVINQGVLSLFLDSLFMVPGKQQCGY